LHALQVGILAEVDRVCRDRGITYHLAYGTLLGAVRHGGYIPWDDDLDVMMPRVDYDRFLAEFPAAADVPGHLSVRHPGTQPAWPLPFAKVSDDRTELVEPMEIPLHVGVNVDVFPLDVVPGGRRRRRLQGAVLRRLGWALELKYVDADRGRQWHDPRVVTWGKRVLRPVPVALLVRALTAVARHPGRHASDRPTDLLGVRVGSFDWSVPRTSLGAGRDLDFEGVRCRVPADADDVLRTVYGDYRTLPPEGDRVSHHSFTVGWRDPLS
jgi:lipopolysaccharide cholinephosphotransferase